MPRTARTRDRDLQAHNVLDCMLDLVEDFRRDVAPGPGPEELLLNLVLGYDVRLPLRRKIAATLVHAERSPARQARQGHADVTTPLEILAYDLCWIRLYGRKATHRNRAAAAVRELRDPRLHDDVRALL